MLEELFGDIFRCMEETLTDELSKTEVGIMKRHITLSKLEKKFTLFAGDKEQRVDLETKKAALACMDAAIATLTDFLEAHPAPENTIFNL